MIHKDDTPEFIGQIIDIFEDFLEERHVSWPNPEREDSGDGAAIIYGMDYGQLQSELEAHMSSWGVIEGGMRVLVVEPGRRPYVKQMPTNLTALQRAVGGYIQAIYPFEDPVALICNEEAKLMGLTLNRALRDEEKRVYDVIAGTFIVAGLSDTDFDSLSDELLAKYGTVFNTPETFINVEGRIVAIPLLWGNNDETVD